MITSASLKDYTVKELTKLAQRRGVSGWKSMKKDDLVKALLRAAKTAAAKAEKAEKGTKAKPPAAKAAAVKAPVTKISATKVEPKKVEAKVASPTKPLAVAAKEPPKRLAPPLSPRVAAKINKANSDRHHHKDLAAILVEAKRKPEKDRLVLLVRDSFWLHVCWEITRQSVVRSEAAMAEQWHNAHPILRLLEVDSGTTTSTSERVVREIEIHSGVNNWYIDVANPPHSYRVEIGYKAANGKFHGICRSNIVTTPAPGSSDAIDRNWEAVAENYERVYSMSGGYNEEPSSKGELRELFEERLRRPMGSALGTRYGGGAEGVLRRSRDFQFQVDAEMILYGSTKADARVTVGGEPIKVRPDGSFTLRLAMPDKRQVIPVVAASPDGVEQRTVVLAIERNTKILEPMMKEAAGE